MQLERRWDKPGVGTVKQIRLAYTYTKTFPAKYRMNVNNKDFPVMLERDLD